MFLSREYLSSVEFLVVETLNSYLLLEKEGVVEGKIVFVPVDVVAVVSCSCDVFLVVKDAVAMFP